MKKIITVVLAAIVCFSLGSCDQNKGKVITIGTMSQPGEPILEHIKEAYDALGYNLKWRLFSDFSPVNDALAEKSVDANLFQHEPYLNTYNATNNTDLVVAKKLYVCEYAGYSKKSIASSADIPNGAKIAIANDASNKSRCLYILQETGLITLKDVEGGQVTLDDITANPKNLEIVEMATANIAGALNDDNCYLGIVNATFALQAGLNKTAKIICKEPIEDKNLNANLLACRKESINEQWLIDLINVLTSEDARTFINEYFGGTLEAIF